MGLARPKDIERYVVLIKLYGKRRHILRCKWVHDLIRNDPDLNQDRYLTNLLVQMYGKCGDVHTAYTLFTGIYPKNAFSWSIMMSVYTQNGHIREAKNLFDVTPTRDIVLYNTLADAYSKDGSVDIAEGICNKMPQWDAVTCTSLITGYAQEGQMHKAKVLFDMSSQRDAVSSTAMLTAFSHNGLLEEAKEIFDKMLVRNGISWNAFLTACSDHGQMHQTLGVFERMPYWDILTCTAMLAAYSEAGKTREAEEMYALMPEQNVVSCTAMFLTYARNGRLELSRRMFQGISEYGDVVVWTSMLAVYGQHGRISEAKAVFDSMPARNVVAWNALSRAYAENEQLELSGSVFERMPMRSLASWNAMCAAYTWSSRCQESKSVFENMPERNLQSWNQMLLAYSRNQVESTREMFYRFPQWDVSSWTILLLSYGNTGHVEDAERVFHSVSEDLDIPFWNAMIAVYVQNGHVARAERLFDRMPRKNSITWNAMISAHAQNGHVAVATDFLRGMVLRGRNPDVDTFRCLLVACSYAGKVDRARNLFISMQGDFGIEPVKDHYCCMVDLLGRSGKQGDAEELIRTMPYIPTYVEWASLLGSCKLYKDVGRGLMEQGCVSEALNVPVEVVVSRVRNAREAQLILDISRSSSTFDMLRGKYEVVDVQRQAFQMSWDEAWLAEDPCVLQAVPLVGQRMSAVNRARCMILKKMENELKALQEKANALVHFIDVNRSIAQELKREGVTNLARDKSLLAAFEEELVQRINKASAGLSLEDLSSMADFMESLKNKNTEGKFDGNRKSDGGSLLD